MANVERDRSRAMLPSLRRAYSLGRCAVTHWVADNSATTGAALAFYCAFSLAPLLVILLSIAGRIAGEERAYGYLSEQLAGLFGTATTQILLEAMASSETTDGVIASIVSVVTLLIGATTVFAALESALAQIWGKDEFEPSGVTAWVRTRVLSFGVILAVGFLLLVSLSISTALTALRGVVAERFTGLVALVALVDFAISLALVTGLIALIYRYLPTRRMEWRPTVWGALATALLFHLGRYAVGLYLSRSTQPSAFGAAAAFAAMLLWLYYTAQIFLLGAEFTACLGGVRDGEPRNREAAASRRVA
jgi:membrane protein